MDIEFDTALANTLNDEVLRLLANHGLAPGPESLAYAASIVATLGMNYEDQGGLQILFALAELLKEQLVEGAPISQALAS